MTTKKLVKLARWRLRLLEFDLTAEYRPGAKNQDGEALSREPTGGEDATALQEDIPVLLVIEDDYLEENEGSWKNNLLEDPEEVVNIKSEFLETFLDKNITRTTSKEK